MYAIRSYYDTCLSQNLIIPAVDLVKAYEEQKNIAVLAYTNDEVMQVYSLLEEAGIGARFIIDREKFHLNGVIEIVEFDKAISAVAVDEPRNNFV